MKRLARFIFKHKRRKKCTLLNDSGQILQSFDLAKIQLMSTNNHPKKLVSLNH